MRNIDDITTDEIIETLTAHSPDWMIEMANSRQLEAVVGMSRGDACAQLAQSHRALVDIMHFAIYRTMMRRDVE
jgi:hypothetical protein